MNRHTLLNFMFFGSFNNFFSLVVDLGLLVLALSFIVPVSSNCLTVGLEVDFEIGTIPEY